MMRKARIPGPRLGNERGQGTTEYILILAIIVIIVLSLLYRFNSSFKAYADAYFGDYVACLLETGELPGVKGAQCTAEYVAYDPAKGKGLGGTMTEGAGGSGSGGSGDGAKESQANNGSRGGSETTGGGGGGRGVSSFNGNRGRPRVATVNAPSSTREESELGGDLAPQSRVAVGRAESGLRPDGGRVQYVYYQDGEEEPEEKPKAAPVKVGDTEKFRPRKVTENPYRAISSADQGKPKEFSISDLVRLLMLIILIVALILFLGGQLIQISKGRDKSES